MNNFIFIPWGMPAPPRRPGTGRCRNTCRRGGWMDNRGFTGGYEPLSDLTNRLNENGRKVLKKLYR